MKERIKIRGLDSLRFIAFFWVFIGHSTPYCRYGYYGIYVFFVLSSFLLTYLALLEIEQTNRFSRRNFFIRRALRIYPLYYLIIISCFIFLPILERYLNTSISLPQKKYLYFLFLSNFDSSDHIFALKFLWSISVEEQFYITFIFLSFFLKNHIYIPVILLYIIYMAGVVGSQYFHWNLYMLTTTYFPDFASGMIAGILFFHKKVPVIRMTAGLVAVFFLMSYMFSHISILNQFIELPISFLIASVILFVIKLFENYPIKGFLITSLEYLGKLTYGLYVYSGFIITFTMIVLPNGSLLHKFIFESIILFIVAWLSYFLFEINFIKLKNRFKRIPNQQHSSV